MYPNESFWLSNIERVKHFFEASIMPDSLEDSSLDHLKHPLSIRVHALPWLLLQCHPDNGEHVEVLVKVLWRSVRSCTATAEDPRRATLLDVHVITGIVNMSGFI